MAAKAAEGLEVEGLEAAARVEEEMEVAKVVVVRAAA